mgnify:CR=1 FL=1
MYRMKKHRTSRRQHGFTLMEIMLVVIIIGILAAAVIVNLEGMSTEARITQAQADIAAIKTQLGLFEMKFGHYPTDEEGGLLALVERPDSIPEEKWRKFNAKDEVPIDPWDQPYIYRIDSETRKYVLYSMGPNSEDESGEGDDVK